MRRAFVLVLLPVALACVDTNITEPGPAAGGVIFFASDREDNNFEIYSVGGNGAQLRRLTNDDANDRGPVASPDGRLVAWQREIASPSGSVESVEIWVMNADGTNPRAAVSNGSFNGTPSWMPDGTALVYASFVAGNWEIFRSPVDGGGPDVNLTGNAYADQHPRVSPDGSRITFHSNRDLNFEIYSMAADGGDPVNLSMSSADDRFPSWSPDGSTIVWSRFVDNFDIWRMDADGGNKDLLVGSAFEDTAPSVSPDGQQLVFQTDRIGSPRFALFIMSMAGGEARPVLDVSSAVAASDLDPYWSR